MSMKLRFNSKNEVPEALAGDDVAKDGAWVLDVDGGVDEAQLEEFRGNNVGLMKQLAEQKKRCEGIDLDVADAPHLVESNAGGGAAGNGSGGAGGGNRSVKNPFRKETWNVTEQMKLQKSDPQLAARLKAAA